MPDVAKITLDDSKVKLADVLKALKKAKYPAAERVAKKEKKVG